MAGRQASAWQTLGPFFDRGLVRAGNDAIDGGVGHDAINGGRGNDVINGGEGSDSYVYARSDGNDTISEGS